MTSKLQRSGILSGSECRFLKRSLLILLFLLAVASVCYLLAGHQIVETMYHGTSRIESLNGIITDQDTTSLDYYLDRVDELFWIRIVVGLPCSLIFYFLLYKVLQYLFRKVREGDSLSPPEAKHFRHDYLLAALIYMGVTILYFYPQLRTLSAALIGPPADNMQFIWTLWCGGQALINPEAGFTFTNHIFFPEGTSLLYHTFSWYNLGVSLPLKLIFNQVTTYNLLIMHTFPLAGIGAFLLTRYLTGNSYLALLGGFIYAFNPSHFARSLEHLNIASIQFIPFFVLYFVKTVREGSLKDLMPASIFFLLSALCSWNYLIFNCYFIVFAYIYLAIRRHKIVLRDVLIRAAVTTGIPLLILSPWLYKMVVVGLRSSEVKGIGHNWFVGDFAGLFIPGPDHLLAGISFIEKANNCYSGNLAEATVYLGVVAIAIMAYSLRSILRRSACYIIGALAFLLLALGAHPHLFGETIPIILPYRLIAFLPFLSNIRAPSRNIVYVYLFLSVIVPIAVKYLSDKFGKGAIRYLIFFPLILLLAIDYYSVTEKTTSIILPPCYSVIQKERDSFGILDLPGGYSEVDRYLAYQTMHNFKIVQGWASRKIGFTLIDSLELENHQIQRWCYAIQFSYN